MAILTDGQDFIDTFQKKIDQFKKVLEVGVEVDAYDLIDELKEIKAFVPAVKELVDALDGVEIPPVPETIEVKGLQDVTDRFEKQLELLEKISNIKLPDVDVKVESISKANADQITKNVKKLIEVNKDVGVLNTEVTNELIKKLDNVINVVEANKPPEPSQAKADWIPVRRVRVMGNTTIFDDDSWAGGGGGNSGTSGVVIVTNSDGSGVDNTSVMYDGKTAVTPKFAAIEAGSSGDNIIIGAVANKKIRVLSYAFISSGTQTGKWKSGNATDISGRMYFIANTGISAGYNPKGHFQTGTNKELVLNLSQAVSGGGHINYIEVD